MKQIFYNEGNISKIFISPYASISQTSQGAVFFNTLTDNSVCIPFSSAELDTLIRRLENGNDYEELVQFFHERNLSEEWVIKLMQVGILE